MRYWLHASDLPDPEGQVPVRTRQGRVVHGDLGYSRWKGRRTSVVDRVAGALRSRGARW